MTSTLWRILPVAIKLVLTLFVPLVLFSGIFWFNMNDLYIWYMMHSKSLFAAVTSFVAILGLYILAIPSALSGLDSSLEHFELKEPFGHHEDCNTDEYRALKALLSLAIQQQVIPKSQENTTDVDNLPLYVTKLESINRLKLGNAISDEEYEHLKSIILKKQIDILTCHGVNGS